MMKKSLLALSLSLIGYSLAFGQVTVNQDTGAPVLERFSNSDYQPTPLFDPDVSSSNLQLVDLLFDFEAGFPTNAYYQGSGRYARFPGDTVDVQPGAFSRVQLVGTTYNDGFSLQSADISDNQATNVTFYVKVAPGGGEFSYLYKTLTELDYDYLMVDLNNTRITGHEYSGIIDWTASAPVALSEGEHKISFWYTKDGSVSDSSDAVFVDNISVINADGTPATITKIEPRASRHGTDITLYGTGLSEAFALNRVFFGDTGFWWGNVATSPNKMTFQVYGPVPAGTYDLRLSTPYGDYYHKEKFIVQIPSSLDYFPENAVTLAGTQVLDVESEDINQDGNMDLVFGTGSSNSIIWQAGDGTGTFSSSALISSTVSNARALEIGDMDGDGILDIVSGGYGDSEVSVHFGTGGGNFLADQVISGTASGIWSMDLADFDGDGDLDIVYGEYNGNSVSWIENLGNRSFSIENTLAGTASNVRDVKATDLDLDGDLDIVFTSINDDKLGWYENLGGGSFSSQFIISTGNNGPSGLAAADVNNDSYPDLIISSSLDNRVTVFINNGNLTFSANDIPVTGSSFQDVYASDINGDGYQDILYTSSGTSQTFYSLNQRDGSYTTSVALGLSTATPYSVSTTDLNSDGDLEIVSASYGTNEIIVFNNSGSQLQQVDLPVTFDDPTVYYEFIDFAGNSSAIVDDPVDANNTVIRSTKTTDAQTYAGTTVGGADGFINPVPFEAGRTTMRARVWSPSANIPVLLKVENSADASISVETLTNTTVANGWETLSFDLSNTEAGTPAMDFAQTYDKLSMFFNFGTDGATAGELTFYWDDIEFPEIFNLAISDIQPAASAPGDTVSIYGSDFNAAVDSNTVNFGGVNASVISASTGKLIVEVPSVSTGNTEVSVTTSAGTASYVNDFVVLNQYPAANLINETVVSTEINETFDVEVADLNGDGFQDVIGVARSGNEISYFINNGDNTFGTKSILSTAVNQPVAVSLADLDRDGDLDVLSASTGDNKVAWYSNNGNGTFGTQSVISTTDASPNNVIPADLDADGDMDVIVASLGDQTVSWYTNNGDGSFSTRSIISNNTPGVVDLYTTDIDNDGDLDVVYAAQGANTIGWIPNIGGGSFGTELVISQAVDGPASVYAADFDRDGDQDVASTSVTDNKLAWYANDGSGNFGAQAVISQSLLFPQSVEAADMDGDGDQDVVVASTDNDKLVWYANDGSGNFGSEIQISNVLDGIIQFDLTDFDNDGDLDIFAASTYANKISWFENVGADVPATSIAEARSTANGTFVKVQGIVTRKSDFTLKIQQDTAGLHLYTAPDFNIPLYDLNVQPGDSIEISGNLNEYANLKEIINITAATLLSSGNTLPTPINVDLSTTTDLEAYESVLISVDGLSVVADSVYGLFQENTQYDLLENNAAVAPKLEIGSAGFSTVSGRFIPKNFNFEGVITQNSTDPASGYTLYPFTYSDIIATPGELISVSAAKDLPDSAMVKVRGIATTGNLESALNRVNMFIQDNGVGIQLFSAESFGGTLNAGDSLEVVGVMDVYNSLREIQASAADITILNTGNTLPAPQEISYSQYLTANSPEEDVNDLQGSLVKMTSLTTDTTTWPKDLNATSTTVSATDLYGNSITLFLKAGTEAIGATPPPYVDVTGILSSFNGAQLLPVNASDIADGGIPGPTGLSLVDAGTGVSISWTASSNTDIGGYNVYRSVSPFSDIGSATKVNASLIEPNSYLDTSVSSNTYYYYRVTAFDTVNTVESDLSFEAFVGFDIKSMYALSKDNGVAGSSFTIYGTSLSSASQSVNLGGNTATVSAATDSTITVTVPDLTPGVYPLSVSIDALSLPTSELFTVLEDSVGQSGYFQPGRILQSSLTNIANFSEHDLDGDGDLDVLAALSDLNSSSTAKWLVNSPTDPFSTVNSIDTNGGIAGRDVVTGDFDMDGDADIAVAYDGSLRWYSNNGSGVFSDAGNGLIETHPAYGSYGEQNLLAYDVDLDGDVDLIRSDRNRNTIELYLNDGLSNFDAPTTIDAAASSVLDLHAFDIDGDQDLDLISAENSTDDIMMHRNNGNGTFATPVIIGTLGSSPSALASGDVDGDGDEDLLASSINDNEISLYLNDGAGNFGAQVIVTSAFANPYALALEDLDGDGQLDLISSNSQGQIMWMGNNGGGSFGSINILYEGSGLIRSLQAFDINNDGTQDVVAGNYSTGELIYLRNVDSPPSAPTGVTIAAGNATADLGWNANPESDILGYKIFRSTNPAIEGFSSLFDTPTTALSYQDTGLEFGQTYYYQVVAVDNSLSEVTSDTVNIQAIATHITEITPRAGAAGSRVRIDGVLFSNTPGGNTVTFGSTPASVLSDSSNSLMVEVPSGLNGNLNVTVTNGGVSHTSPIGFTSLTSNQGTFKSLATSPATYTNTNLITEDLNSDGYMDLIISNLSNNTIDLITSNVTDPLAITSPISTPGYQSNVIRSINLYGNNYPDLVSISNNVQTIRFFKKDATGNVNGYAQQSVNITQTNPTDLAVADMDEDGKADVVVASAADNTLFWYANQSSANDGVIFGAADTISSTASGINSIYVADFNGDLNKDVLASRPGVSDIVLYLNDGAGGFTESVLASSITNPTRVMAADLDNDGDLDAVYASSGGNLVNVHFNDGVGVFTGALTLSSSITAASDISISDLNGDGFQDILTVSPTSGTAVWFENQGTQTFASESLISDSNTQPTKVLPYDFNQDGKQDVVVLDATSANFTIYENFVQIPIMVSAFSPGTGNSIIPSENITITFDTLMADLGNALATFNGAISITNTAGLPASTPVSITPSGSSLIIETSGLIAATTYQLTFDNSLILSNSDSRVFIDINGNGIQDTNDDVSYVSDEFNTLPIGDFTYDNAVNFDDLILFRNAWYNNDYFYETAPLNDLNGTLQFPQVMLSGNSDFDVNDLVNFIRFWNNTLEQQAAKRTETLAKAAKASASENEVSEDNRPDLSAYSGKGSFNETTAQYTDNEPAYAASENIADTLDYISFTKEATETDYESAEQAETKVTYTFSLSHPDSVEGMSLILDYNPDDLEVEEINDLELFDEYQQNATVFLSHLDSLNGFITLNVVNFKELHAIAEREFVSITFNSLNDRDSEITLNADIRASGKPAYRQIAKQSVKVTEELPQSFALSQNYPNPFNPTTTIHYELAEQARVNLSVYDILGRRVETLISEQSLRPGYYQARWDASRYASGMYFYVINLQSVSGKSYTMSKKMVLVK